MITIPGLPKQKMSENKKKLIDIYHKQGFIVTTDFNDFIVTTTQERGISFLLSNATQLGFMVVDIDELETECNGEYWKEYICTLIEKQ